MDEWIKIYEEPISDEDGNFDDYRTWLHDILDDEAIPYKVEIKREKMAAIPGLTISSEYTIEFYVYEGDRYRAAELIELFQNASFSNEHDELNISEEDLTY